MNRWDILNHIIRKNNYKSFLEIGYFKGWNFDNIQCEKKLAVDPQPSKTPEQEQFQEGKHPIEGGAIMKMTSDNFFQFTDPDYKWDIIFIDGLHEAQQVLRDIENSLKHLSEGGTIVLHDMNPPTYEHTTTGDAGGNWNGTCYKAILSYGPATPFIYYTIDTDWGVGILKPFRQISEDSSFGAMMINMADLDYTKAQEDWDYFDKNRKELLNIISVEEFLKREAIHATA